jgi:hypothetical protein
MSWLRSDTRLQRPWVILSVVLLTGFAIRFPLTFMHDYVVNILHWET